MCCYASLWRGRTLRWQIWACESDEFTDRADQQVVFLEGFSGYFFAEFLQRVDVQKGSWFRRRAGSIQRAGRCYGMIPLQVELQRAVKAAKDEAMTVEQAAEYLKVHPDSYRCSLQSQTI